ncbi:flavodoxin domain-containing protein [Clostridioides difficile]|uniref:flavodoxin domain-containing protein n=1 Tax=Clostridioides difficile TaxID=1496 RepID=UPI0029C3EEF8|nr:flavodoxin domain-containing protein [Clostridioides difficile]MDX5626364.1 flavodoxin domain-containing protein [Clostridioides difficile]
MKNVVVIYKSKYGSTKKYAKWLSELLSCDIFETKNINIEKVMKYDTIILGGGLYACNIAGISFLKKNYKELQKKNLVVFGVGAAPYDDEVIKKLREVNFKDELNKIPCFYCRGAWDETKMSFIDYTLCSFFKKSIAKKERQGLKPAEAPLLSGEAFDWCNKEYFTLLLTYIRAL